MAVADHGTCSKGHSLPLVTSIVDAFGLQESNVLCVYLVGSHLWNTCQVSSDFDLVIILKELSAPKPLNHHKRNLEAFILSKEQYIEQLNSHSLQLLITLWLPKECVLRELFDPRKYFHLSRDNLVSAIEHHKERDFRVAQKHFLKDDKKKSKKILLHSVRYLCLAVQIKTTGKITDYSEANQFKEEILGNYCQDWAELLCTVNPIVDNLLSSLLS